MLHPRPPLYCREEKDVSGKGQKALRDALTASVHVLHSGTAFTITSVSKCEGDVRQVMVRGQARLGFELSISASWAVVDGSGAAVASGTLAMEDVTDTDSDLIGSLTCACTSCSGSPLPGLGDAGAAKASVVKLAPHFRNVIRDWVEDMKRR